MKIFQTYEQERGKHQLDKTLFWEYHFDRMDLSKCPELVVRRVVMFGSNSQWYAAFDLLGGIEAFRKIAKNEVITFDEEILDEMCEKLDLVKEETRSYIRMKERLKYLGLERFRTLSEGW